MSWGRKCGATKTVRTTEWVVNPKNNYGREVRKTVTWKCRKPKGHGGGHDYRAR